MFVVVAPVVFAERWLCATLERNRRSSSASSNRERLMSSGDRRSMSCCRRRNTCLPMQLLPTNFFEMRIGSQFKSLLRNVRSLLGFKRKVKGSRRAVRERQEPVLELLFGRLLGTKATHVDQPVRVGLLLNGPLAPVYCVCSGEIESVPRERGHSRSMR